MIELRIEEKCEPVPIAGCLIWTGYSTFDWYGRISFKGTQRMVHRLVYEIANGPIQKGMLVCHRCDNRSCCNPHHLFLGTNKENMADMKEKKRQSMGERRPDAKLTERDVADIRGIRNSGIAIRKISAMFNVSKSVIHMIVSGKSWKHV